MLAATWPSTLTAITRDEITKIHIVRWTREILCDKSDNNKLATEQATKSNGFRDGLHTISLYTINVSSFRFLSNDRPS